MSSPANAAQEPRARGLPAPAWLALLFLVAAVGATAWLSDDAYFTLRTVDNALHGHGLRWNVVERVQVYTHPLWMLVLTGAIGLTRDFYFTPILLSLLLSLAAALLVARGAPTPAGRVLALSLPIASRAFVDYATSGLENPLAYVLIAVFAALFLGGAPSRANLLRCTLVAALAALNRQDTLLVFLPALALRAWQTWRAQGATRAGAGALAARVGLGFAPLVLWELFSFVYYGFPFPNTAYAKLGTGIAGSALLGQGLHYAWNSLTSDPLTLATVLAACAVAARRRAREPLALAAGIALYLAYTLRIGGDFMSGRFFAVPFLAAVALLAREPLAWRGAALWAAPVACALAGLGLHDLGPLEGAERDRNDHGIVDERRYYCGASGLFRAGAWFTPEEIRMAPLAEPGVVVVRNGKLAFGAGAKAHVLNEYALGDPLLARLPTRFCLDWRIGHYLRTLPAGYRESLESGEDRLVDRELARFDERLRAVTRGPLFDLGRLRTALAFNLGRYRHLVDETRYRFPFLRSVALAEEGDGSVHLAGPLPLPQEGVRLTLRAPRGVRRVTLRLEGGELGRVELLDGERSVWRRDLALAQATLELGDARGDRLWIVPLHAQLPPFPRLTELVLESAP